jgi:hypothetical protein
MHKSVSNKVDASCGVEEDLGLSRSPVAEDDLEDSRLGVCGGEDR